VWLPFVDDERAVRELVELGFVETVSTRTCIDAFSVELRVNRICSDLARVKTAPDLDETVVVASAAQSARPMSCGQCRRFIEEEELREPAGPQERSAPPAAKVEPARDPALAVVAAADVTVVVVEAAPVSVHQAAGGVSDQLAAGRHAIP
jgi:hypothetical protein